MSTFDTVSGRKGTVDAAALEARLRERFDVVEHQVTVGERTYDLRHPRSADALIDDAEFNKDERLPYWAEIWPSAYVLARRITGPLTPALSQREREKKPRLLELGCGSGLAVVAALGAGFEVTAIDYYEAALEFVCLNALINGLPLPEVRVVDWREYPADLKDFDVVVAADVLYESNYCRLMAAAYRQSLRPGGLGLMTDPQRCKAEPFPGECRKLGLQIDKPQVFGPLCVPGGDTTVCQTVDLFEVRRPPE